MNFCESLTDKCDEIRNQHPYCELVVVGDFNAHYKGWWNHQYKNYDLTPIVTDSIFECQNSSGIHILDLYLTTIPHSMEACVEAGIGNSDHNLVIINISIDTTRIQTAAQASLAFQRS